MEGAGHGRQRLAEVGYLVVDAAIRVLVTSLLDQARRQVDSGNTCPAVR